MKRLISILLYVLGGIVVLILLFFLVVWATEWKPGQEEVIHSGQPGMLPDTLTILTWNTGYAGLGDDMDFFMDGGKGSRTSRERTEENLRKITDFLVSCKADIILLQEVDRDSKRSYHTDQFAVYQEALPDYHGYFALNYKSPFVPVPLLSPVGKVESGVAIFSKIPAGRVVRHQYNSRFSFPVRLFNLKRCWLSAGFRNSEGRRIWIGNTHNSAYESGNMRRVEMEQVNDWMITEGWEESRWAILGGDWNQTPPGYIPSPAETENQYFSVKPLIEHDLLLYGYDDSTPSMRYLYEPLTPQTTRSVTDFFDTSFAHTIRVKTFNLGFKNSDHNPVMATFRIKDNFDVL